MGSKHKAYFLTFFSYASVHMLRMTYSFNKHSIEKYFGIDRLYLGILDSLIFIFLALGSVFRYSLTQDRNPANICLKTAIPTALALGSIALVIVFSNESSEQPSIWTYIYLILVMSCFGFFQFASFPATLTIFSRYYNVKTQGAAVGIWSSKSNAGNIIGFFCANFLVFTLHVNWEYTILLAVIFNLIISFLLYYFLSESGEKQNTWSQPQNKITTKQFFQYLKKQWKSVDFKLYILSFSCFKAILYSYQLWTPTYLSSVGFSKYSGYVPMVFDISTLLGSLCMGKLYQDQPKISQESVIAFSFIKKYKFFIASIFISSAALCYILLPSNVVIYFILGAIMGCFLGAVYNSLQNNQVLSITHNKPRQTDMFSSLNIAAGSALVAVFQLVIGVFMRIHPHDNDPVNDSVSRVYIVIAALGIIAMILTYSRSFFQHKIQAQKTSLLQNNDFIGSVENIDSSF